MDFTRRSLFLWPPAWFTIKGRVYQADSGPGRNEPAEGTGQGYSIVQRRRHSCQRACDVENGERLKIKLSEGNIACRVTE